MPCCAARPGTISVLVRASGTASGRPVASTRAVPDGLCLVEAQVLVGARRRRRPMPSWLTSSTRTMSAASSVRQRRLAAQREASPRTSRLRGLEGEAMERTVLVSPDVRCRAQWDCAFPKKGVSPVIGVRRGTLRKVPDGSAGAGVLGAEVLELFGVGPGGRRLVGRRAVVGARGLGPALGRCPRASSAAASRASCRTCRAPAWPPRRRRRGCSVGVGVVGVGVVAGARPSPLPGHVELARGRPGPPGRRRWLRRSRRERRRAWIMGTASRGAKRMRPPLSGAARPSGGRTSGSR